MNHGSPEPGAEIRVAFFTDCYYEVNGVALTSRQFVAFARQRQLPFLSVRPGAATVEASDGSVRTLELANGPLSVGVERDLAFDLAYGRHFRRAVEAVERFQPDCIHVTSPGTVGLLGRSVAKRLGIPMVASWHTNVHEFGARRLSKMLQWMPAGMRDSVADVAEDGILRAILPFYRYARVLFAPNPELVRMLEERAGRPCYPMERGIDTTTFAPRWRTRFRGPLRIGFVGRLSPEKNVRALGAIDERLRASGVTDYEFSIVGDGNESAWLRQNLSRADMPGVLKGRELAEAYANMDVFLFPSETDTYGNVVQEALASGVPCVVSGKGGPKFIVQHGLTGFVANTVPEYAAAVASLLCDPVRRRTMSEAARRWSEDRSWGAVFEGVYARYRGALYPKTSLDSFVSRDLHQTGNIK